jgi:hypothetical protein
MLARAVHFGHAVLQTLMAAVRFGIKFRINLYIFSFVTEV